MNQKCCGCINNPANDGIIKSIYQSIKLLNDQSIISEQYEYFLCFTCYQKSISKSLNK